MTKLGYLEDTYLFKSEANLVDIKETEHGKALVLDRTIFYPQGGGQPSDIGEISSPNGKFIVKKVMLDPEGTVWHFGEFESGSFSPDEELELKVNEERRVESAKTHSAAHLIDGVIEQLNWDLIPFKSHHFPDGCYIECEGTLGEFDREEKIAELESALKEAIEKELKTSARILTPQEASEANIKAPEGKDVRVILFDGMENRKCGCGGTHVRHTGEIGSIKIKNIKSKKGNTKISYTVN